MNHACLAALGCILWGLLGGVAHAGEIPSEREASEEASERPLSLPEQLGTPAREDAVLVHVARVREAGVDEAKALTAALRFCGGLHAAEGLRLLARHRELDVRVAALECLGALSIRSSRILSLVRRAARAFHEAERCAAIRALGRLGDGSDMEPLLDLASAQRPAIRLAAFTALRSLSGESVPLSVPRWSYWWKRARERWTGQIERALESLELEPTSKQAGAHLATLRSNGWICRADLLEAIRDWLRAPDGTLRAHACDLAAYHRLADAHPELEWLAERGSPALRPKARRVLVALGAIGPADS